MMYSSSASRLLMAGIIAFTMAVGIAVYFMMGSDDWTPESDVQSVMLVHDVEQITACGQALAMLDENRPEKAREVLELWMRSSSEHAKSLVRTGVSIDGSAPNLHDGVARAGLYARQHELTDVSADIDEILEAFQTR